MRPARRRGAGFTLLELMVVLAITAVLVSQAVPSFGAQIGRIHLKAAAERLTADLAEARFESTRRGIPVHVHFAPGAQWCYVVATADPCECGAPGICQIRSTKGSDHKGVVLERAVDLHFEPANGTALAAGAALLRSARGEVLQVQLTRLGRARICAPDSVSLGYPAC